jgi:hypothetical protein
MPKLIWPMPVRGNPMGIWGIAKEFATVAEARAWVREFRLDTEKESMLLVSGGMVYRATDEGFASAGQFEGAGGPTGPTGPSKPEPPRKPHLDGTWYKISPGFPTTGGII